MNMNCQFFKSGSFLKSSIIKHDDKVEGTKEKKKKKKNKQQQEKESEIPTADGNFFPRKIRNKNAPFFQCHVDEYKPNDDCQPVPSFQVEPRQANYHYHQKSYAKVIVKGNNNNNLIYGDKSGSSLDLDNFNDFPALESPDEDPSMFNLDIIKREKETRKKRQDSQCQRYMIKKKEKRQRHRDHLKMRKRMKEDEKPVKEAERKQVEPCQATYYCQNSYTEATVKGNNKPIINSSSSSPALDLDNSDDFPALESPDEDPSMFNLDIINREKEMRKKRLDSQNGRNPKVNENVTLHLTGESDDDDDEYRQRYLQKKKEKRQRHKDNLKMRKRIEEDEKTAKEAERKQQEEKMKREKEERRSKKEEAKMTPRELAEFNEKWDELFDKMEITQKKTDKNQMKFVKPGVVKNSDKNRRKKEALKLKKLESEKNREKRREEKIKRDFWMNEVLNAVKRAQKCDMAKVLQKYIFSDEIKIRPQSIQEIVPDADETRIQHLNKAFVKQFDADPDDPVKLQKVIVDALLEPLAGNKGREATDQGALLKKLEAEQKMHCCKYRASVRQKNLLKMMAKNLCDFSIDEDRDALRRLKNIPLDQMDAFCKLRREVRQFEDLDAAVDHLTEKYGGVCPQAVYDTIDAYFPNESKLNKRDLANTYVCTCQGPNNYVLR